MTTATAKKYGRHELLAIVRGRGFTVAWRTLEYMLQAGKLPEPERNRLGHRRYSDEHLDGLISYLEERRAAGA